MSLSWQQTLLLLFAIFNCNIIFKCESVEAVAECRDNECTETNNECTDHNELCPYWAAIHQCQRNHTFMLHECPVSCDSCNDMNYNELSIGCPKKYPDCESCSDTLSFATKCPLYKQKAACNKYPGYMMIHCAKTCKYCHLQSNYDLRCPKNQKQMQETRIFAASGDLNTFFENIVSTYNMHKNLTEQRDDGVLEWELEILSTDPWVLRFDNFFTELEAKGIIEAAGKFERSTDVGKKDNTGHFAKITSKSRTSSNAWCHERCWRHPMVQRVMTRTEGLLNISMDNSEHLQILQYEEGEFYATHNDYIPNQVAMSCGPRVLTWYMYLNDVEEGGHTAFPKLNLSNPPKLGRVILWPSVLDSDPMKVDRRTVHTALPVKKGVKYGANAWIHTYDFQTPNLWSCTG